jgi:hyperosmotically inducible periplasmic protein
LFIQNKLFGDTDISALSINIETNNGKVSLSGTASSKQEIDNAIRIAKSVSGVDSVVSSVAIKLK